MWMDKKTFDFEVKQVGEGKISGWANVYTINNFPVVDRHGDIIQKNALSGGQRVPILVNHDINKAVGVGYAYERDYEGKYGIWIELQLAIDSASEVLKNRSMEVYEMAKKGILSAFSIGFITKEAEPDTVNGRRVRKITSLDLVECSCVITPSNPESLVTAVKSGEGIYKGLGSMGDLAKRYEPINEHITVSDVEEGLEELYYHPMAKPLIEEIEKRCFKVMGVKRYNLNFVLHDYNSRQIFKQAIQYMRNPFVTDYIEGIVSKYDNHTAGLKPIH